jgi:hypothetical protein
MDLNFFSVKANSVIKNCSDLLYGNVLVKRIRPILYTAFVTMVKYTFYLKSGQDKEAFDLSLFELIMSNNRARDVQGGALFSDFFSRRKSRSEARQKPGGLLSGPVCKPEQPDHRERPNKTQLIYDPISMIIKNKVYLLEPTKLYVAPGTFTPPVFL